MTRPVHFEILADEPEKVAAFYTAVFGWKIAPWEDIGEPYWMVTTGADDAPGIDGGIMRRDFQQAVINTISVASLARTLEDVERAGGTLVQGPTDIPGVGRHAYCADPEGNLFGVMQPNPSTDG